MKIKSLLFTAFAALFFTTTLFAQIPNYVPTNGLVGWWPFNGNANDESGNGNNGTVNGATLTADRFGVTDKAFNFNGLSNYIQLPFGIANEPISVSVWFKSNIIGFQSIIDNDIAPLYGNNIILSYPYYNLGLHDSICILYHDGYAVSNFAYLTNQYYHIVATWENTFCSIFINGQLINSYTHNQGINEGGLFRIGVHSNNDGWFNGTIDDVAIWNRALSECEISDLYNSQLGSLNSTSTQTETALDSYTWPVNGQTYTQSGQYSDTLTNAAGCDSVITLDLTLSYTGIESLQLNPNKKLVKITDLNGKESPFRKNMVLLFIYEDGTVERAYISE
jgi:hypothetical protein